MTGVSVWLAADYQMATGYSIRMPPSSPLAGRALPTPGPATVQLAMIRVGIELFGIERVRESLFGHIVATQPKIQPPQRIGVSDQLLKAFKADDNGRLEQGLRYREFVHAEGAIRVFVCTPVERKDEFKGILQGIGYWGQANGLAACTQVCEANPVAGTFAIPLESMAHDKQLGHYFSGAVSEIVKPDVHWTDIVANDRQSGANVIRHRIYVWPLIKCAALGNGQIWRYCSLA